MIFVSENHSLVTKRFPNWCVNLSSGYCFSPNSVFLVSRFCLTLSNKTVHCGQFAMHLGLETRMLLFLSPLPLD